MRNVFLFGVNNAFTPAGWADGVVTLPATNCYLEIGVTNWSDQIHDIGIAMSGVTVGGKPIHAAEPAVLAMFGFGALLVGVFAGLRRRPV